MSKETLKALVRAFATAFWFFRWAFALMAYVLAVTPGGFNWDWFVVGPLGR